MLLSIKQTVGQNTAEMLRRSLEMHIMKTLTKQVSAMGKS
jgi:hypothetical protein